MHLPSVSASLGMLLLGIAAVYALLTFAAAVVWRVARASPIAIGVQPPVTLLIPLCGAEPQLYENLRCFCLQRYPIFQLVLGVCDSNDPALTIAERVAREFPALAVEIVVNEWLHGSNRKISNLINMLPSARYDLLFIIDSDTRVDAGYLDVVTRTLLQPGIGLVTCLYRSVPIGSLWSTLGSMYVNDWYMPSVMLARLFGHRNYVSGQTMGLRRETLAAMGGLEVIVDHLADDYQLGLRVRRLGLRIALASATLDTPYSESSAGTLTAHEIRWLRTLRALAPASFAFLFLSFGTPLQLAGVWLALACPQFHPAVVMLLAVSVAARLGGSCLVRLERSRLAMNEILLLPLRDLLLCWTWSRAAISSRVHWRGYNFEVDRLGMLRSLL